MADEIAMLKQLQAGINASFEAVYAAQDSKALATAKEGLVGLGFATAGAALGPTFSLVSLTGTPLHYMAVRVAIALNLFDIIAAGPTTLTELAEKTKANPRLIKRILRMVTAIGYAQQKEANKWEATPLTLALSTPVLKNWMIVHFDKRMEIYAQFPEWLEKHNYQTTWADDKDNICFQVHGSDIWEYYVDNPEMSAKFDSAMSIQETFPPEMVPYYPFTSGFDDIKKDAESITFVDVGGGHGQAVKSLKQSYPDLPGRFVVQDLPAAVAGVDPAKAKEIGFEPMAHDFFQPQPIKGAKYYHLRRVLHDWDDEACLKILAQIRPAMEPQYSKLLISDFVLSDVSPGPVESQIDLLMMVTCNGCERDETEWSELLKNAGFKIDKILRAVSGATCVIEASIA